MNASLAFEPIWSNYLFTLYQIPGYEPRWVEAEGAKATVTRYERKKVVVEITQAEPGATLLVKIAHFPRWLAEAEGQPLLMQMNDYGLTTIALPPGDYTLHLR